ncbi:MAG TPA: methylated-DNA--[protein]-cysteine S-methyltransferase [Flavobacteriaceae bacterium]|nr:methylated-DNA--[protein]-cysteine S-methyltransferase [Flavobacteriaceae bacterium]
MYHRIIPSPIGNLKISASEDSIVSIEFTTEEVTAVSPSSLLLREAQKQLEEYFHKERQEFSLPLSPYGTTFQQKVWKQLQQIPYGETRSYRDIAIELGNLRQIRAAATANGKNPIPIVIPCHRVIGSNGSLTGYSGGLEKKKWLLELENPFLQTRLF